MEELLKYWPFLIALVGVTIWLIRLEGKIMLSMQKLQFHDETIVKLQMDNRKQFEGLSASLNTFQDQRRISLRRFSSLRASSAR